MSGGTFLGDLVSPVVSGAETLVLVAIGGAVLLGVLALLRKRKQDHNTQK